MSLEQFLSKARDASFTPSVDRDWNIQNAYNMICYVLHILTILEKDQRYSILCIHFDKKESYLALQKELDVLVDKYNLRNWVQNEYIEEEFSPQLICQYDDYLRHADKLAAQDSRWKDILYDSD